MAPLLSNQATVVAFICATIHNGSQEQAIMVATAKGEKELFTQCSFQDTKAECKLARVLFSPSGRTMEKISDSHCIQNYPVTRPSLVAAKNTSVPT